MQTLTHWMDEQHLLHLVFRKLGPTRKEHAPASGPLSEFQSVVQPPVVPGCASWDEAI